MTVARSWLTTDGRGILHTATPPDFHLQLVRDLQH
jgi:hypothetical protein